MTKNTSWYNLDNLELTMARMVMAWLGVSSKLIDIYYEVCIDLPYGDFDIYQELVLCLKHQGFVIKEEK